MGLEVPESSTSSRFLLLLGYAAEGGECWDSEASALVAEDETADFREIAASLLWREVSRVSSVTMARSSTSPPSGRGGREKEFWWPCKRKKYRHKRKSYATKELGKHKVKYRHDKIRYQQNRQTIQATQLPTKNIDGLDIDGGSRQNIKCDKGITYLGERMATAVWLHGASIGSRQVLVQGGETSDELLQVLDFKVLRHAINIFFASVHPHMISAGLKGLHPNTEKVCGDLNTR
jgi:hypothetical protein